MDNQDILQRIQALVDEEHQLPICGVGLGQWFRRGRLRRK